MRINKIGNLQSNSNRFLLSLFYPLNLFCPVLVLLLLVSIVPVHILILLPPSSRCVDRVAKIVLTVEDKDMKQMFDVTCKSEGQTRTNLSVFICAHLGPCEESLPSTGSFADGMVHGLFCHSHPLHVHRSTIDLIITLLKEGRHHLDLSRSNYTE